MRRLWSRIATNTAASHESLILALGTSQEYNGIPLSLSGREKGEGGGIMRQVISVDKCTKNDLNEMKKGESMSDYMIGGGARRRDRRCD